MFATPLALFMLLGGPARAADIDSRFSLGVVSDTEGAAGLGLGNQVSIGFAPHLPRPELSLVHDLSTDARFSAYAVGLRQPIGDRLSVAAHVGLLVVSGRSYGYEAGLGVDGGLAYDLLVFDRWALGLVTMAGHSLTGGPAGWWGTAGIEVHFGR